MVTPGFMPYVRNVGDLLEKWEIHYYTGILPAFIIAEMMTDITIRYFRERKSERLCAIEIFRILFQTYKDMEKFEKVLLASVPTDGKAH